jgi:hypothetical protein
MGGEARRRAEAHAHGRPYRPPRTCPRCKSIRISRTALPATALSNRPTDYDLCRDCGTVWEAYPDDWCTDVVGAEPCDNCAFRPGSPEQEDAAHWRWLIGLLRAGGQFRCHKGAPIDGLEKGEVQFDADWVGKHGRSCAGFMRMVWAMREKGEDWLAKHGEFVGAPGFDCEGPPGVGDER